jgi:hypothetical protein
MPLSAIIAMLAGLAAMLAVRVLVLLIFRHGRPLKSGAGPVKTMVVLGSGAAQQLLSHRSPPLALRALYAACPSAA